MGAIPKKFLMNSGVGSKYIQTTLVSLQNILKQLWSHYSMGVSWKCYTEIAN